MKILVIDIGNTSTSLGVYSNKGITKSLKVLNPNDKKIKIYLDSLNIDTVAIASVTPLIVSLSPVLKPWSLISILLVSTSDAENVIGFINNFSYWEL